ncbi:MAG: DUF4174 domain-containing protein [Alphaproteobacteria bacterium]|nr:DUF4174 domain-containing protein [Alphaproteobacteria bacterium]RZV98825.1 MAG: DUF4174 domain-containing protein [Paracoccaceae bacterium]
MTALNTFVFWAALLIAAPALAADGATTDETELPPLERWLLDPTEQFLAADISLEDFRWIARPLVIFADTEADPRFRQQIDRLAARPEALAERDVVIFVDTDPSAQSEVRKALRPRGFMIVLIGKDGGVKLRKPFPWDVRELSRQIDKMPMRQQEIRDAKEAAQ